jgi:signal transduction histidine kinase
MAKTDAERIVCPGQRRWRRSGFVLTLAAPFATPARAQVIGAREIEIAGSLNNVVWAAVTAGTALAALVAFALLLRTRGSDRSAATAAEVQQLRSALDRTEALLDADDQRTLVFDSAVTPPLIFGGLPERAGAPPDKTAFLNFAAWLTAEATAQIDAATEKLRRQGEAFQLALRTQTGALLEVTGRTSGRRSLVRFRELTGERRSFAELKEQATFVVTEVAALRALANLLPVPLWRRNRLGRLTWVNAAYVTAVDAASAESVLTAGIELLPSRTREAIREAERAGGSYRDSTTAIVSGDRRKLQILDTAIEDGTIGCAIDVTEVDSVREELKRSKEANARLLDQLASAVVAFDKNGVMLFHNAAFRSLWDLSAAWLATKPEESALLDQLRADRKLPEQANYRDWRAKHLAAYRSGAQREEWWHLPDRRTLRMVAMPSAEGGMTYLYENVTEQLTLESRLKALLQLQGETLDHLSEAVAVFGTDGRLRLFNPVFANIWRLSPTRLREEPHIGELIADCQGIYDDKRAWDEIRAAVTDLEHDNGAQGRMQRPDGSVIDYATVALPEGMTMLTFVDVTDSARIQRVLSERNEALEAADQLKSDFIQHVSYELRSPLTSIIGFAEMLSDETVGSLNPTQREYMDHIASSSSSLLAIINDILDLATVDAGIMSLDLRETDVAAVAASAVEGLRDRLSEQRITLDLAIPKDIGTFHVDEQRVRQILFNLVSNAIRFSNAGGHVRLEGARQDGWVVFTVRDDGVGIPDDVMPSIFQPFEAHGAQGRRRGAGLGLSIVKSLVELHGGEVEISSEEGKGTTAVVRLPAFPAAAAVAAE